MKMILLSGALIFLSGCQESYIKDVGGGTVEVVSSTLSDNQANGNSATIK